MLYMHFMHERSFNELADASVDWRPGLGWAGKVNAGGGGQGPPTAAARALPCQASPSIPHQFLQLQREAKALKFYSYYYIRAKFF